MKGVWYDVEQLARWFENSDVVVYDSLFEVSDSVFYEPFWN